LISSFEESPILKICGENSFTVTLKGNAEYRNNKNSTQLKAYPVRFQLKSYLVFMFGAKLLTKFIEVFDNHSSSLLRRNVKILGLLCLRPKISNASQL